MAPSYVQAAVSDEQAARERRLNQVRRRLAYRSWLIPQLATVLEWPGGRVGVRAALRELAELGEVEERDGGEWHATPALQIPGRPHRPHRPRPTQAEEAAMPSIPEQITALLAKRPWLTARQIAETLGSNSASVAASKMATQGRLQRRQSDDGIWEYAPPDVASDQEPSGVSVEQPGARPIGADENPLAWPGDTEHAVAAHDQVMQMQGAAAEVERLRSELEVRNAELQEWREGAKGIDRALDEAGVSVGTPARTLVERIQVLGALVAEDEVSDEVVTELREQLEQARLERDNWHTGAEQLAANLEAANRKLADEKAQLQEAHARNAELVTALEQTRVAYDDLHDRLADELPGSDAQDSDDELLAEVRTRVQVADALTRDRDQATAAALTDRRTLAGVREALGNPACKDSELVEYLRGRLEALRQLVPSDTVHRLQALADRVTELERERDELYTAMGPGPGMSHVEAVNYATQLVELGKRACERAHETAALDAADAHRVRELEEQVRDLKGALNQATTRHEQLHNALADALLTGMRESSDEVLVDQVRETNAQLENVHAERDDALQRVNALEQQVSPLQRQTALLTQAFRVVERLRLQEMARQRAAQAGAEVGHRFAEQLADVTVRLFNCVLMVEGDVRDTTPLGLAIELQRHLQKQLAARSEAA